MENDKRYVEPLWFDAFMALSTERHKRSFVIDRQFGDAKYNIPNTIVTTAMGNEQMRGIELRFMSHEPQIVLLVTYGMGDIVLGDVREEDIPQIEQWIDDANKMIEDARKRRKEKNSG